MAEVKTGTDTLKVLYDNRGEIGRAIGALAAAMTAATGIVIGHAYQEVKGKVYNNFQPVNPNYSSETPLAEH